MPLTNGGFIVPADIRLAALADDYILMVDASNGIPYKISKADLLADLSSGSSGGSDVDNLFSNVVLLLSNDNSILLDKSSLVNSFSNTGVTINSGSKFGANSAYFAGGNSILTTPNRTEFNLGNGDFTTEAWVYPTMLDSNPRYILSKVGSLSNNSNRSYGLNLSTNNIQWYWTADGINDYPVNFSCTLTANDWHHIAISRSNGILYGFLDGILLASVAHTDTYFNSSAGITIGSFGGYAAQGYPQLSFIGNIEKDGLRITKNCRYTASFALPTKAFPSF